MTLSRRQVVLGGAGTLAAGAAVGVGIDRWVGDPGPQQSERAAADVASYQSGPHQPGVHLPATPAPYQLVTVLHQVADDVPRKDALLSLLDRLGAAVLDLQARSDLLPDGLRDLTVQIGIGPRWVAALDPALPGADPMPAYRGSSSLPPRLRTGDLVVLVAASDPSTLAPVGAHLAGQAPGTAVSWQQLGIRAPGRGAVTRNPFGFQDGVIVPHDQAALDRGVWIASGPATGATVGVIRRFHLDVERFEAEPVARQEEIVGRRKADGAPLSGGGPDAEVNLLAKSPTGDFLTPAHSHARAAHPSFTGRPLMMRRSYGFTATDPATQRLTAGLLFTSYQNDLLTFVRTQQRLDDEDDLMTYATPTAEVSFLVLPGFGRERPLGSTLR